MAGYMGYSMSNNAVEAYNDGEKPLSRWTKEKIIKGIEEAIEEDELELKCDITLLKKTPLTELKNLCLEYTSWHHTSEFYNATDFYSLDLLSVSELTNEDLKAAIAAHKPKIYTSEKWECSFLEWSGSKRHPKATEVTEIGTIRGQYFFRNDGSKKKITANGFRKIKKVS